MTGHDERMHSCLYSNDGRVELCERICKLEGLVHQLYECATRESCDGCSQDTAELCCQGPSYFLGPMRELGIEVDE